MHRRVDEHVVRDVVVDQEGFVGQVFGEAGIWQAGQGVDGTSKARVFQTDLDRWKYRIGNAILVHLNHLSAWRFDAVDARQPAVEVVDRVVFQKQDDDVVDLLDAVLSVYRRRHMQRAEKDPNQCKQSQEAVHSVDFSLAEGVSRTIEYASRC